MLDRRIFPLRRLHRQGTLPLLLIWTLERLLIVHARVIFRCHRTSRDELKTVHLSPNFHARTASTEKQSNIARSRCSSPHAKYLDGLLQNIDIDRISPLSWALDWVLLIRVRRFAGLTRSAQRSELRQKLEIGRRVPAIFGAILCFSFCIAFFLLSSALTPEQFLLGA